MASFDLTPDQAQCESNKLHPAKTDSDFTVDQARELWIRHEEQGTSWWILARQGATTEPALRRRVLDLLGVTGDSVEREEACGCQCDGPSRWCAVGGPLWRAMQDAGKAANGDRRGWSAYAAARQTWMEHLAGSKAH